MAAQVMSISTGGMAAQVMSISTGGSFLDSPGFNHNRRKIPPSGFNRRDIGPPIRFDAGDADFQEELTSPYTTPSQVNTPDSGFSGTASSTLLKTPESDICSSTAATPSSSGSVSTHRKRKTVNFDESQTSIVVISPDDLFNTYSKNQTRQEPAIDPDTTEATPAPATDCDVVTPDDPHTRYVVDSLTGWPLKRSDSLESRDNPFLPGGELSREAEDLLRRATIIRDNFYLNEEERKTLQEQQQQQLQQQLQQQQKQLRTAKKVQIVDQDGHTYSTSVQERQQYSPSSPGKVDERVSPQSASNVLTAAPHGNEDSLQPRENGKAGDGATASPDSVRLTIPDSDGQSIPLTQTGPGGGLSHPSGGGELQVHDSDKKRRNKCCSVM